MPEFTLSEQAYGRLRTMIVRLDLAPGDVLREEDLKDRLGIGRTPIREALQRLAREHFVTVIPRRGMFVATLDVSELSMLFETRTVLEPYAGRLAAARGTAEQWEAMARELAPATRTGSNSEQLMDTDRRCHELIWEAAGTRCMVDTLDTLYAQSARLWHLYLSDVGDMRSAIDEHRQILDALRAKDGDTVARLVETHVRAFDEAIRFAVTQRLEPPLTG